MLLEECAHYGFVVEAYGLCLIPAFGLTKSCMIVH